MSFYVLFVDDVDENDNDVDETNNNDSDEDPRCSDHLNCVLLTS